MRINRTFLSLCRTVHVYLTMFGLLVMLLFSITGFTINHEGWFGATHPVASEIRGTTPVELLESKDALRIVEHLRSAFLITGAMTSFDDLDDRVAVNFKSPNQIWEVEIEKPAGTTIVQHESSNFVALINNLHRGRYSGASWAWVIDLSALLIVLACFTGVVLWLVLPKRRLLGILWLAIGTLATVGVYYMLVPGRDVPASFRTPHAPPSDAAETRHQPDPPPPSPRPGQ